MSVVVRATDLSRRFGNRWAYARLDLQVEEGERLLIVGANGSGKTSLLRTLATLVPASRGSLEIFGSDPVADLASVRRRVGLLSHRPGFYEDLSGPENLEVVGRLLEREVPGDLLSRVGLEVRDDPVRQWSAGMRKRLAFALVLLKDPDLVLLDEPYGQLDPAGMDRFTSLIAELRGTVVVASHQVQRAARISDRVLLLEHGLERWAGPADQAWPAWRALQVESAGDEEAAP
ncbi:MAG: ABC transporter ATP-binding protein [Myxococcota bacterium]|jgi:heme exporter protein A|nr:ABC transporter ATP-binding protein [Myxococcota bacterium]